MGPYEIWDLGSGGPKMDGGGLCDEWVPMGCGVWGRVALKWRYGAQGWMGIDGLLWDVGFGVEWTKGGVMGPG